MTQAFVKNSADRQQVREAGRKERFQIKQRMDDLRQLMTQPAFRRVVWWLVNEVCHVDASSASQSGSTTYLLEGERQVGRIVKAQVCIAAIDAYQQIEREYYESMRPQEEKDGKLDSESDRETRGAS